MVLFTMVKLEITSREQVAPSYVENEQQLDASLNILAGRE